MKFREDSKVSENDAIVELCQKEKDIISAVLITKKAEDFGRVELNTRVPIIKVPAFVFMYLFGRK